MCGQRLSPYRLIRRLALPGEDPGALAPGEQEVLARVDRHVRRVVGAELRKEYGVNI